MTNPVLRLFAAAVALAAVFHGDPASAAEAARPNIVFLLADDLGYGDLGCTGHPFAKTPSIDRLAKEGTLFRNFYVGGATCCPSRTAFMSGRFPATFQKYPAAFGFSGALTVTDLLKQAGYRTGHFGKWHIGAQTRNGTFGIDSIQVIGGNRRDPRGRDAGIADAMIEFLKANQKGPFFVNVWFHTPHNPVNPPQPFVDRFKGVPVQPADFAKASPWLARDLATRAKTGDDVALGVRKRLGDVLQLDNQVARVLKALDDLGLRKNTLVVFTSDNGPNAYGSPGPFRGAKHTLYDGGIHQPLIVRWPGRVTAGRDDRATVTAGVDWLPTLCALAGAKVDAKTQAKLDGEDVSDIWLGKERSRARDLFWKASAPRSPAVMRRGNWKLHLPSNPRKGDPELYDLASDPAETTNVASKHPQVLKPMLAALRRWNASLPTSYAKGDAKDD